MLILMLMFNIVNIHNTKALTPVQQHGGGYKIYRIICDVTQKNGSSSIQVGTVGTVAMWYVGTVARYVARYVGTWYVGTVGMWYVGAVGIWYVGTGGIWYLIQDIFMPAGNT